MICLIKNARIYAPEDLGQKDLLVSGNRILTIEDTIEIGGDHVQVIDASGKIMVPGIVDSLAHFIGGGGEGGFKTRTPEMQLSDAIKGGVTTMVGALGTDATTRTLTNMYAKAKGLTEEGITCYMYTGGYQVPSPTLTDSIRNDLILIDICIGVGEVAIADHRSSQPSEEEIARIASEVRVGGLLSGKGGIVSLHMGDGKRKLSQILKVCEDTELPITQFYPTHINRNRDLFNAGIDFAKQGGYVDFTASTTPELLADGDIKCSSGLKEMLDAGVNVEQITFSSDGNASLPIFDKAGKLVGLQVGQVTSIHEEIRDSIIDENIAPEIAWQVGTKSPANILSLDHKGQIKPGLDADLLLCDPETWALDSVMAMGTWLMKDKEILVKGTFE